MKGPLAPKSSLSPSSPALRTAVAVVVTLWTLISARRTYHSLSSTVPGAPGTPAETKTHHRDPFHQHLSMMLADPVSQGPAHPFEDESRGELLISAMAASAAFEAAAPRAGAGAGAIGGNIGSGNIGGGNIGGGSIGGGNIGGGGELAAVTGIVPGEPGLDSFDFSFRCGSVACAGGVDVVLAASPACGGPAPESGDGGGRGAGMKRRKKENGKDKSSEEERDSKRGMDRKRKNKDKKKKEKEQGKKKGAGAGRRADGGLGKWTVAYLPPGVNAYVLRGLVPGCSYELQVTPAAAMVHGGGGGGGGGALGAHDGDVDEEEELVERRSKTVTFSTLDPPADPRGDHGAPLTDWPEGVPPLVLYTIPKSFKRGQTVSNQRNAIRSWTLLQPRPRIVLFGDEEGVDRVAEELGVTHVPELKRNEHGTPLLSSVIHAVDDVAGEGSAVVLINSDIVLMQSFIETYLAVAGSRDGRGFLMIGCRYNLKKENPIDFESPTWASDLEREVKLRGHKFTSWAIDYFAYPVGSFKNIPPFLVGRFAWDNWLVTQGVRRGKTKPNDFFTVDASNAIIDVHLDHDYNHVKKNANERAYNTRLTKGDIHMGTTDHARYRAERCPDGTIKLCERAKIGDAEVAKFKIKRKPGGKSKEFYRKWDAAEVVRKKRKNAIIDFIREDCCMADGILVSKEMISNYAKEKKGERKWAYNTNFGHPKK